ncbi:MAG TPA: sterol desaturase family protein [Xanthobacteraceae bacterium]|nr:sterol desaturase family protein [Xanthobacteraceae bacterium]
MYSVKFLRKVRSELDAPREARPFGSGWISGSIGLLAGIVGLLMVVVLRNPTLASVPQLGAVYQGVPFRIALYFVLVSGFLLAALSLVLRKDKALGGAAMIATLLATMIGSLPAHRAIGVEGVFFGVDFFILNVLFTGLLFIPIERLFPKNPDQAVLRDEWREDLFYYLVSSLFIQLLTYLTLAPSNFVVHNPELGSIRAFARDLPWVVQFVVIMVLTDFAQYWLHRAFHRVPALWRFHAVHHSAKSMDWIAGARMHFAEIIILRSVTATPMLVIGFSESAIQAYTLLVYVYSTFIHSNVRGSFGFLEKILVVPRFHHWHHGIEKEAVDVNFAIHFPFLDRLFGTHHMPENRWPAGYGIEGHPVPRGYWKQLLYPFQR